MSSPSEEEEEEETAVFLGHLVLGRVALGVGLGLWKGGSTMTFCVGFPLSIASASGGLSIVFLFRCLMRFCRVVYVCMFISVIQLAY